MRDFARIETVRLPAPPDIGHGLYDMWLQRCRREAIFEPVKPGPDQLVTIDVWPHPETRLELTGLLVWTDRLVRDIGVIELACRVHSYGILRGLPPGVSTSTPDQMYVKIYVELPESSPV
ncbi:MAG: hypothetical protein ACM31O_01470 [Bacteroidota bacterium]